MLDDDVDGEVLGDAIYNIPGLDSGYESMDAEGGSEGTGMMRFLFICGSEAF
jgi:hypothetical protein